MKKFYITLAAVAAMALSAGAQNQYFELGNFADYDEGVGCYDGGAKDESPINFYHYHSASQIIYTAEDLAELIAENKEFDINEITYKYYNASCFYELNRKVSLYIMEVEDEMFRTDIDGHRLYFDFDINSPAAELVFAGDMLDIYGMSEELTFTLNEPYVYGGQTLVVTVVADGEDCTDCAHDISFYAYQDHSARNKAMTYALDAASFAEYMQDPFYPRATEENGSAARVDQPITRFGYAVTELPDPTAVEEVSAAKTVSSVRYFNMTGAESAQPFDGINIVETRYTDGTTSTAKVIR